MLVIATVMDFVLVKPTLFQLAMAIPARKRSCQSQRQL